uniref:Uncharacterized protein n=1 Tax=Kalanchoe fedtschenkoi TaxID=63787 RepID=A0A7N0RCS3_KALFE
MKISGALFGLVMAAMLLTTCLATSRMGLIDEVRRGIQEDQNAAGYYSGAGASGHGHGSSSSVNNHHYIPRQDFNNYSSSGGPKGAGGGDNNGDGGSGQTTD